MFCRVFSAAAESDQSELEQLLMSHMVTVVQIVEKTDPLTNTTKLQRQRTWFGSLSAYSIGYKYANQTLFTFLPLILLLVFNTLLVRQVTFNIQARLQIQMLNDT